MSVDDQEAGVDAYWMGAALRLGRRQLGLTAPNPAVGALIVRDGKVVVGRGSTARTGRPHAEVNALAEAGGAAKDATLYVSLEPCAHHGGSPPCTDAVIASGIRRVVIATLDPDPRVAGEGVAKLRAAGLEIAVGVGEELAAWAHLGHVLRVRADRPFVQLKIAHTVDGDIASATRDPLKITGPIADRWVHRLRAEADAILIGSGTAIADNPQLTCRLAGREADSPIRIIADSQMRLPLNARLLQTASVVPTWIITGPVEDADRCAAFMDTGAKLIHVPLSADRHVSLHAALSSLAQRGITRVLVEGGAMIAAEFMRHRLVDELILFEGKPRLTRSGLNIFPGGNPKRFFSGSDFALTDDITLGVDRMRRYCREDWQDVYRNCH